MNPLNYSQRHLQKRLDRSVDRTKQQCLDYEKNCLRRGAHAAYSEGTIDPTTKCAQIRELCHEKVDRRAQRATNPISGKLSDRRVGRVEYKLWNQRELQESDEIKRKMMHTNQAAQANRNNDKNLHFFG
ncbi:hypothetical protein HK405_015532 [Cladochytrium tenue]|nr:hypothetical protein HK405_015532 [Cladochytrium tenue]